MSKQTTTNKHQTRKQAWAELGQAKVKFDNIVVIIVEVVVKAMVEVEIQLLFWWVGGWSDKTKSILISTLVEVAVEVELGNYEAHVLPLWRSVIN